jgi:hypothetical protein
MSDQNTKRHKHADAIVAWANGETIEYRECPNSRWKPLVGVTPTAALAWYPHWEYRVRPKEVVAYSCVFNHQEPGKSFFTCKDKALEFYSTYLSICSVTGPAHLSPKSNNEVQDAIDTLCKYGYTVSLSLTNKDLK